MAYFTNEHLRCHFSERTLIALAKKGIRLLGATAIPGTDGSFLLSETGYHVSDNGTGKVWTFIQVLNAAKK